MEIKINGELQEIEDAKLTINRLLSLRKIEAPEMVSVQLNGKIIDRNRYGSTAILENDEVEFLYFMGGGA